MNATAFYIREAIAEHIVELSQTRLLDMVSSYGTVERANEELRRLTGVRSFFPDAVSFDQFRQLLSLPADTQKSREFGDFQTPAELAAQVCRYLAAAGVSPRVIIEPTYGEGSFIFAALNSFPTTQLVYGVEIQERYEWQVKIALLIRGLLGHRTSAEIELRRDDIFKHRFSDEVLTAQDVLIIGNPPWVTNAELSGLNSRNVPSKKNIKSLNGLDAMTGKSNFDIGEFAVLRLLELFSERRGTLAMLCKNTIVKNVVEILPQRNFKVSNLRAFEIDANREFGAAVDASLFVMDMGVSKPAFTCQVAPLAHPERTTRTFGWTRGRFVSNAEDYESHHQLDGKSPLVWRQGLKHDCSKIMELDVRDGRCVNGNGESVDVEGEYIYWLLKSSDLQSFGVSQARKKVIVTQRSLAEGTAPLKTNAPKLWEYLTRHREHFENRKSSIYRNRPPFSMFGIGEYSFSPYKVAVSGLYKEARFALVVPMDGRPVMLDDTCYFLPFDNYLDALFTALLLNSPLVKRFLKSIVFVDAKRPYTKEVLMRLNLTEAAARLTFDTLQGFWSEIGYQPREAVTESDFREYKERLHMMETREHQQLHFML